MDGSGLKLRRAGVVAQIILDRPAEGNALDIPLAEAFRSAVATLDADETVQVLMIRATGKLFCGGGDLVAVSSADDPRAYMHSLADTFHGGLEILSRSRLIVVGVLQGTAAGGGLGLVLHCDYVLCSTAARFASAYSAVGLTPDSGVSFFLPRVVGMRRAVEMIIFGRTIDAATALEWGLVNEVVAPEALQARAEALGRELAASALQVLGPAKRLLLASAEQSYKQHLEAESESISAFTRHEDSARRMAEFAGRRRSAR